MKKIIVTGCCGFIGFSLSKKLLGDKNIQIIGIDIINDYYDVNLKKQRLKLLKENKNFQFKKIDIKNYNLLEKIFKNKKIDIVYNLAAQAGVQYSIKNPKKYMDSNCVVFFNILELSRVNSIKKFFMPHQVQFMEIVKNFQLKKILISIQKIFMDLVKKLMKKWQQFIQDIIILKLLV